MAVTDILPLLAAAGLLVFAALATVRSGDGAARPTGAAAWRLPAGLALAFLAVSLVAALREGPLGFWPEHTRNLWGNQIWFDLLLLAGIGWFLALPRLRAAGLAPWPWLALILATGSIGFLAMIARLLYREARR